MRAELGNKEPFGAREQSKGCFMKNRSEILLSLCASSINWFCSYLMGIRKQ